MGEHGAGIAALARCGAARGAMDRGACVPRVASGSPPESGRTLSVSELPRRWTESWVNGSLSVEGVLGGHEPLLIALSMICCEERDGADSIRALSLAGRRRAEEEVESGSRLVRFANACLVPRRVRRRGVRAPRSGPYSRHAFRQHRQPCRPGDSLLRTASGAPGCRRTPAAHPAAEVLPPARAAPDDGSDCAGAARGGDFHPRPRPAARPDQRRPFGRSDGRHPRRRTGIERAPPTHPRSTSNATTLRLSRLNSTATR